jgi:hypothetical protein
VRPLASTCATGVGLSTRALNFRPKIRLPPAGLKVRPELTCVPGPWISDPRYSYHRSGLEGATGVSLCTWAMDFRPKVQSVKTMGS